MAPPRDRLQCSFDQRSGSGVVVKAVPTWLPVQDVLGLHGRDVGHGGEDVGAVHRRALQAVAVVDLPLARLPVDVKLEHTHSRTGQHGQPLGLRDPWQRDPPSPTRTAADGSTQSVPVAQE